MISPGPWPSSRIASCVLAVVLVGIADLMLVSVSIERVRGVGYVAALAAVIAIAASVIGPTAHISTPLLISVVPLGLALFEHDRPVWAVIVAGPLLVACAEVATFSHRYVALVPPDPDVAEQHFTDVGLTVLLAVVVAAAVMLIGRLDVPVGLPVLMVGAVAAVAAVWLAVSSARRSPNTVQE